MGCLSGLYNSPGAIGVVYMAVSVNDRVYRFVADRADGFQNRRARGCHAGINQHDAFIRFEESGVNNGHTDQVAARANLDNLRFIPYVFDGGIYPTEHILRRCQGKLPTEGTTLGHARYQLRIFSQYHHACVDIGSVGDNGDGALTGGVGTAAGYFAYFGATQQRSNEQKGKCRKKITEERFHIQCLPLVKKIGGCFMGVG